MATDPPKSPDGYAMCLDYVLAACPTDRRGWDYWKPFVWAAGAELKRLREENARLRICLEPFIGPAFAQRCIEEELAARGRAGVVEKNDGD